MNKKTLAFITVTTVFALGVGTITISGLHQVERIKTIATNPYSCELPEGYHEIQDAVTLALGYSNESTTNPYTIRGTVTRIYEDFAFIQRVNQTTFKTDAIRIKGYGDGLAVGNVVDITGGQLQTIYDSPTLTITNENQLSVVFAQNPTDYSAIEYEGVKDFLNNGWSSSTEFDNAYYTFGRYIQINGVIPEDFETTVYSFEDEEYSCGWFYDYDDRIERTCVNIFAIADASNIETKINTALSTNKLINIRGTLYAHKSDGHSYYGILISSQNDIEITNRSLVDSSVIAERVGRRIIRSQSNVVYLPTYYLVGKGDVPYVEVGEFINKRNQSLGVMDARFVTRYTVDGKPNQMKYFNNNYGFVIADSENDTITVNDTNGYFNENYNFINGNRLFSDGGETKYVQVDTTRTATYNPGTNVTTYDLGQFDLDIVKDSEGYMYAQLTVIGDIFYTNFAWYAGLAFNGKDYYSISAVNSDNVVRNAYYGDTPWATQEARTQSFADYSYNALLFSIRYCYGLQEVRGVTDPDALMESLDIKEKLKSTDNETYQAATIEFVGRWLFECHSGLTKIAPIKTSDEFNATINDLYYSYLVTNPKYQKVYGAFNELGERRSNAGKGIGLDFYEDTAFVRFDEFVKYYDGDSGNIDVTGTNPETDEEYTYEELHALGSELFFKRAFKDIETHGGIHNVVIDLSNNGGGHIDVVPWLLAYMTDHPSITINFKEYNQAVETYYNIDLNQNGIFGDEGDTYKDTYNFYLLVSNGSFSCGNFLPTVVGTKHLATLIGEPTGGGICAVGQFASANGTIFRNSSVYQLGSYDNGFIAYEDGIAPDIPLARQYYYNNLYIYNLIHGISNE